MPQYRGYISIPWLGILITLHTLAFTSTIFRIAYRQRKEKLAADDVLAIFSGGSTMFMFGTLLSIVITRPLQLSPTLLQVIINMYFVTLWFSRASLIMGVARIFHEVEDLVTKCRTAATIMINAGLGYCIAINLLCYFNSPTNDTEATVFSAIPLFMAIVILLTDVLADLTLAYISTKIIVKMRFLPIQEWTIRLAFSCSMWTLVSNATCWLLLITQFHSKQPIILCLANLSASISNIVTNTPFILRTVYKTYFKDYEKEEATLRYPSIEAPSHHVNVESGNTENEASATNSDSFKSDSSSSMAVSVGH
ncbi:hypothetical protein GALMADRAFT_1346363 [Galerina marginata CBS 339.88]|uniref:G-protein coupled receptors family 1 profile domain-containing protein n=1 Tax=Galerina marginata (strain CBS 339.88) TaxID=685588 RepID=A0A067SIN7_GALM3|nr:hypothetical protein GALMADRAFT_1346363 [Galerina marginata CBS 339.88]